jgi:hypothetical protein
MTRVEIISILSFWNELAEKSICYLRALDWVETFAVISLKNLRWNIL